MSRYLDITPPKTSPWGPCQDVCEELDGVWYVTTASHGGYLLSPERNAMICDAARRNDASYEEDSEWSKIVWTFREELEDAGAGKNIAHAKTTLLHWYPDIYEEMTGELPDPAISFILKRRREIERVTGQHVVKSAAAIRSAEGEPRRLLLTTAVVTGEGRGGTPNYDRSTERTWIADADEYGRSATGFVVIHTIPSARPYNER